MVKNPCWQGPVGVLVFPDEQFFVIIIKRNIFRSNEMTDQERMTSILSEVMQVDNPTCLRTIAQAARDRRKDLLIAKTRSWQVGDSVQQLPEHQSRKPYAVIGKIVKINRVKMVIDFGPGPNWNFPPTMLQKV
jgi:hypothetical protein